MFARGIQVFATFRTEAASTLRCHESPLSQDSQEHYSWRKETEAPNLRK